MLEKSRVFEPSGFERVRVECKLYDEEKRVIKCNFWECALLLARFHSTKDTAVTNVFSCITDEAFEV